MLSPSINTNENGYSLWAAANCAASWYWRPAPLPLSPMTANFSESGALGSVIAIAAQSEAGSDSRQTSNSTRRRIVNDG